MEISTERVWTELRGDLLAFFRRRVSDEHAALDLVGETFLRVHDGLEDLEREDRLEAWVWSVARNVLTDHRRRAGRPGDAAGSVEDLAAAAEPGTNLTELAGGWARMMIAQLPAPYRVALELSELEGLPQRAVADRLELSLSGAKSRIQRGRALLRDLVLACCHLEFDDHGNVVDYVRREQCGGCAEC